MAILAQFRNYPTSFTLEGLKLDYIRESVKSTAFKIIEACVNPEGSFPYQNHLEAMKDLDSLFRVHNLYAKAITDLNSLNIRISSVNSNKIFN